MRFTLRPYECEWCKGSYVYYQNDRQTTLLSKGKAFGSIFQSTECFVRHNYVLAIFFRSISSLYTPVYIEVVLLIDNCGPHGTDVSDLLRRVDIVIVVQQQCALIRVSAVYRLPSTAWTWSRTRCPKRLGVPKFSCATFRLDGASTNVYSFWPPISSSF